MSTAPTASGSITPDKLKSMFEDLGKPTMRGVRKCPKCGTYNGTRGISCKNKNCDQVFKDKDKKKAPATVEAVKIITGSTVQVFSVRLRDRGPDYRGFVQLPIVQDMDGNPATAVDPNILAQAARCYVDSCVRNGQFDIASEPCNHIRAAIASDHQAQPLTFKNSVLNSLQVTNDLKQEIWLLATMTTGPLVQRVSKNIMVVKCKANSKHPLGFLHFSFFEGSKNKNQDSRYQCSCKISKEEGSKRCVHFYACICAFASDEKLSDEFSQYITLESGVVPQDSTGRILTLYSPEPEDCTTEIVTAELSDESVPSIEVVIEDKELFPLEPKRPRKDDSIVQASNALLTLQESAATTTTPAPKKTPAAKTNSTANKTSIPAAKKAPIDENEVSFSFHQWLASVTERVNQTMHYQFDGNPEPLVFHAPQVFFDCMQQRISTGNKKKRLPNFMAGFVRKDALPLGTFTKYTWHITNILHVKQIFDTTEMPLEITRSFVENRDGTYTVYETPNVKVESCEYGKNQTPIRPFELKTYLKVGHTQSDQKDPTPFIIEWIPDILPESHIGELRIKFEYGHQRNGQIEHRPPSQPVEMQTNIIQIQ